MKPLPKTLTFRKSECGVKIEEVESRMNCTFVGDFCIKDRRGQFVEQTVAIFWQETPPQEGYSNYFALFVRDGKVYITSGETAFDSPIYGIVARNGEIVYSRHRWDCRSSSDGSVMIDGGRDYMRLVGDTSISAQQVELKVNGPIVEVHPV